MAVYSSKETEAPGSQDSVASHSGGHARSRNHKSQEVNGGGRFTSNSGSLAGPRLRSRLRASLGAGLGAGGAGAGGTATAGPLQGALQDRLRSPEVGVAVWKAERGDYTLDTLPSTDTVQSSPTPGAKEQREHVCDTARKGSTEMTVMSSSVELPDRYCWMR